MEQPDLTGAKTYVVAERPSLGAGRWYVLPDDATYYQPDDGDLRPSLIAAHTLRDRATWAEASE